MQYLFSPPFACLTQITINLFTIFSTSENLNRIVLSQFDLIIIVKLFFVKKIKIKENTNEL